MGKQCKDNEASPVPFFCNPFFVLDRNVPMDWTNAHDVVLCREVLVVDPFQAKKKTIQRAKLWQTVANNLIVLDHPKFKSTLR